ncbi:hypothetical protein [Pseudomonas sp. KNUC1026]|uniref:hypothetical protein n=1 Tax=Pseudomonas sp. KNUC1026 TaxID=2893890 RepID=UPI001F47DADB|nr:hypothetical protein [Pseudomonas sp. KNUC1026]UFH50450.1 hypothetical protein LN139_04175 [Pseudomonas sp. KNUC1026]
MSIDTVERLLEWVEACDNMAAVFQKDMDWDAELDARDDDTFDRRWVEENRKVSSGTGCESELLKLNVLREAVFKKVYRITSNPELAGCASDDFGLIGEKIMKHVESDWVDWLLGSYLSGHFPS